MLVPQNDPPVDESAEAQKWGRAGRMRKLGLRKSRGRPTSTGSLVARTEEKPALKPVSPTLPPPLRIRPHRPNVVARAQEGSRRRPSRAARTPPADPAAGPVGVPDAGARGPRPRAAPRQRPRGASPPPRRRKAPQPSPPPGRRPQAASSSACRMALLASPAPTPRRRAHGRGRRPVN